MLRRKSSPWQRGKWSPQADVARSASSSSVCSVSGATGKRSSWSSRVAGRKLRAFRSLLIFRAILLIAFVGRRLPLRLGRACGSALGRLAWHVARRERNRALKNIALAFPDWPTGEHERVIRQMFRHHGMSLFEIVWLPNLDQERAQRTTKFENLETVLDLVR